MSVPATLSPDPKALEQITAATGLGAFVIGGVSQGGGTQWGQDLNEGFVKSLWELPALTVGNMLEVLADALRKLPLEALQQFQTLFPDLGNIWNDAESAINGILSQVIPKPAMQSVLDFENWVGSAFTPIQTIVNQLLDIVSGNVVTPINAAVQAFKDGWANIGAGTDLSGIEAQLVHMTSDGFLSADAITGALSLAQLPSELLTTASSIGLGQLPSTLLTEASQLAAGNLTGTVPMGNLPSTLLTAASQLAAGNLTGVVPLANLPGSLLTTASSIAASSITGVLGAGAIPNLPITQITGLTGRLTNLDSSGLLSLAGLATGTLPSGIVLPSSQLTGMIPTGLIPTITAGMTQGLVAVDTLVNAWGRAGSGFTTADLTTQAQNIPYNYIRGLLGSADVGGAVQQTVNAGTTALGAVAQGVDASLAQWQQALGGLASMLGFHAGGAPPQAGSVAAITQDNNQMITDRAVQKDVFANIDRSIDSSFPFSDVYTATTLPTIAVTQANPVSVPINIRDGGIKQSIRWKGYVSSGTLTGFYVNLYYVNPTTGAWTWFWSSSNYVGSVATGSAPQWNSMNLAAAAYINTNQGDLIQAEITIAGSATYTMVGKTLSPQLLPMPGVFPSMPAATRIGNTTSYSAVGAGATKQSGTPHTVTTTVNIPADANAVLIYVSQYIQGSGATTRTADVGGVSAAELSVYSFSTNSSLRIDVFGLIGTPATPLPTGTQTVTFSVTGSYTFYTAMNVVAYKGALAFGTPVTATGTSAAPSMSVASTTPDQLIGQIFIHNLVGQGFSGYNQNQRWMQPEVNGVNTAAVVGDAVGNNGTVTFSSTISSSTAWGGVAIPISGSPQPAPVTVLNPLAPGAAATAANPAVYARNQPWIGLAGSAAATQYSPVTPSFGAGSGQLFDPNNYAWANYYDVVIWGGGGGGCNGGNGAGLGGFGATPTVVTLSRSQITGAPWTVNVGSGGGASANGGSTSVVIPGYGTVTANGGAGQTAQYGSQAAGLGQSAGSANFNDHYGNAQHYPGGAGGASAQAGGQAPGGGGAGGNGVFVGSYIYGGSGGNGIAYIRCYQ